MVARDIPENILTLALLRDVFGREANLVCDPVCSKQNVIPCGLVSETFEV
jgi:hypothetical protein